MLQDLAYGTRVLRKSPAFTALIVGTLALGIGANTAVFSIVQAVLLRPLPYRDPARLNLILEAQAHNREAKFFVFYRHFQAWADENRSYAGLAAATWARGPRFLVGRGAPQSILGVPVTVDFFSVLGVPAQIGRTFARGDLTQGCTAVLSHGFWQRSLGGQAGIVGQRLTLDDSTCSVIGIMPPAFAFYPAPTDLWTLITPASDFDRNPDRNGVAVVGRLKPGVSKEAANAELSALTQSADKGRGLDVDAEPVSFELQEEFTWLAGHNLRLSVLLMLAAVGLVLLIACANVANLLLSRSLARQRELAIRTALGSGRMRLLRQLLTESLLLSIGASALGVAIAASVVHWFRISNPVNLPPGAIPSVNIPVLAFTLALSVATTILFGLVPAWQGSQTSVGEALKSGGRGSVGWSRQRLAKGLVVAETTLSLVLLAGAGLLIQSIANFASAPLGFREDRLLAMNLSLPQSAYSNHEQQAAFYRLLESRIHAFPGVEGAGLTSHMALKGSIGQSVLTVEGRPAPDPKTAILDTEQQSITEGYLRFLGIPLERGREFERRDREGAPQVAVINRAAVRKYFPGEDPIGRHIRLSTPENPWLTVVGVAGDEKQSSPFQEMSWMEPPIVYRPLEQQPAPTVDLVVRARSPKALNATGIQREILKLGPDVRIAEVSSVEQTLDTYTASPRFRAVLMGWFAGFALLLAALGLYGVLSQLVAQRTQEIGIRMALGAQQRDVLRPILKQGMLLAGIGTALGVLAATLLTRLLASLLYGVGAHDPVIMTGVSLTLLLAALAAAYLPARRALRVNPIEALRAE